MGLPAGAAGPPARSPEGEQRAEDAGFDDDHRTDRDEHGRDEHVAVGV